MTDKPTWVCWGPYWYPDGKHVVYAGADHATGGRPNYDLYWMDVDSGKETRITFAPGRRRVTGIQQRRNEIDVDIDTRRPVAVAAISRLLHGSAKPLAATQKSHGRAITETQRREGLLIPPFPLRVSVTARPIVFLNLSDYTLGFFIGEADPRDY